MKKYFEVEKCTHHTTEILVNASENMSVEIVPVGCKMSHFTDAFQRQLQIFIGLSKVQKQL